MGVVFLFRTRSRRNSARRAVLASTLAIEPVDAKAEFHKSLFPLDAERVFSCLGIKMLTRNGSILLGLLMLALSALAQPQLLLDPTQAPITLKGRWEKERGRAGGGGSSGQIVVKISKINPDGTFEGRLDLQRGQQGFCSADDEPITEGRITSNGIKVVANGGVPATCGMMTLEFRRGEEKWLQGRIKSEAQSHGARMWLDAPK